MSVQYQGSYSSETFNAAKRYKLKFQKNVPLADIELSELNKVSDSFVRQLVSANFPTGSTINNGFKVVESTTPTNNFTIKGGVGTVNGAGVLFVDGYILFLKNDIEYNGQDATGSLTDDGYTETDIPALTTPSGNRTDEVYVDFYFAEVSGTSGSEYEDSSLLISGIGINTANRIRMVQDIRVAEGGTTPANGNDLNGIYHWYIKIATINRLGGNASITNAMITDNRILVNSNYSYMNGTAGTIKLVDGADIGDSTHRISNIYMNSNIDFENKLSFSSNGEKICFTTDGKIGIGTTNPQTSLHIVGDSTVTGTITGTLSGNASTATEASRLGSVVHLNGGNVGIGTTNPTTKLHVVGDTLLTGNLTVNGTTTTVNTEVTTTDMMVINQNDNQVAFSVNQTAANSATVMEITNAGSGHALVIGNGNVGIGTINPLHKLDVNGNVLIMNNLKVGIGNSEPIENYGFNVCGTSYFQDDAKFNGNILSENNDLVIKTSTPDGDDFRFVTICGGGAPSITRGGHINVYGNENATYPGMIRLLPGNVSTGVIQLGGRTYLGTRPSNDSDWDLALGKFLTIKGLDENESYLLHNAYHSSGWKYRESNVGAGANYFNMAGGFFEFKVAGNGTKDTAITWNNALKIIPSGNVGINLLTPLHRLHVNGSIRSVGDLGISNSTTSPTGEWYFYIDTNNGLGLKDNISSTYPFIIDYGAPTESIKIASNGNVGIGKKNPVYKLHIFKDQNSSLSNVLENPNIGNNAASYFRAVCEGTVLIGKASAANTSYLGNSIFWNQANTGILLGTNNTERMRILANGNVGIGITNPLAKLHVIGDFKVHSGIIENKLYSDVGNLIYQLKNDGGTSDLLFLKDDRSLGGVITGGLLRLQAHVGTQSNTQNSSLFKVEKITGSTIHPVFDINSWSGNVGIGTTNPTSKLHVVGDILTTGKVTLGAFASLQTNTGSAWLGRAFDEPLGSCSIQLGGIDENAGFRIVDRAWTKSIFSLSGAAPNLSLHVNQYGSVGVGSDLVEPWNSNLKVLQIGSGLSLLSTNNNGYGYIRNNAYLNTSEQDIARYTGGSVQQNFYYDNFSWYIAPSVTAGNVLTYVEKMKLNANSLSLDSSTAAGGPTATPFYIDTGLSYSNGTTMDKCKIFLYKSATDCFGIGVGANSDVQYHSGSGGRHDFYNGNVFAMTIGVTKVGIGITNPSYQLQLSTDSAAKPSTNTWTVASDIRVKKHVEDFNKYGLEDLLKLRPVQFEYNGLAGFSDDGKKHVGYIAQEVEQIIPEMVSSIKTKLKSEDDEEIDLKNVNTHLLSFAIIEALRSMKNEIDSLKKEIEILKNR